MADDTQQDLMPDWLKVPGVSRGPAAPAPAAPTPSAPASTSVPGPAGKTLEIPGAMTLDPQTSELLRSEVGSVNKALEEQRALGKTYTDKLTGQMAELESKRQATEQSLQGMQTAQLEPTQFPSAPPGVQINRDEFGKFFGLAFVFAMLMGKAAKTDMVDGLNMLSSSIMGYQAGAKEKASEDREQFKLKMEAALNDERQKLQRYNAILRSQDMDLQRKKMALELEAARIGDTKTLYELQSGNIAAWIKGHENNITQLVKVHEDAVKMYQSLVGYERGVSAALAGMPGKMQLIDYRAAVAERQDINKESRRERRLDQKALGSARSSEATIADIDRVIDMVRQMPSITGARGMLNRWSESLRDVLGNKVEGDTPAHRFQSAMILIQQHIGRALAGGRLTNQEANTMRDMLKGLKIEDGPTVTVSTLEQVKSMLQENVNRLDNETLERYHDDAEVEQAIRHGALRRGDYFLDDAGNRRQVP
jgi:hypothetical protein